VKIKHLAWQMLCLFLCAGVSACAALATNTISKKSGPICVCETQCKENYARDDCPVCSADFSACAGLADESEAPTEPESEPQKEPLPGKEIHTSEGTQDASAPGTKDPKQPQQTADVEPQIPTEASSETAAIDTASSVAIVIAAPTDWDNESVSVGYAIKDTVGNGFTSAKVKTAKDTEWQEVTEQLELKDGCYVGALTVNENSTVYVNVTGRDGQTFEKSYEIKCLDKTVPTIETNIADHILTITAKDELSGIAAVYIDGKKFDHLKDGKLEVPLSDFSTSVEQIVVEAEDKAGNKSQPKQVQNPNYQKPETTAPATETTTAAQSTTNCVTENIPVSRSVQTTSTAKTDTGNKAGTASTDTKTTDTKTSEKSTVKSTQTGSTVWATDDPKTAVGSTSSSTSSSKTYTYVSNEPKPLTPDGQGTVVDEATDEDGKEFYTITTPNENVFYLVIDKQRDNENVYFLNAVTESDLMALAEKDASETEEPTEPEPEPICSCTKKCAAGEVDTKCPVCILNLEKCQGIESKPVEESDLPQKSESNILPWLIMLLAGLAAGGAGYYFKIYKPRHDLDDAEDFDDLTDMGEEETINEDDEPDYGEETSDEPENPIRSSRYDNEPDEPDYPDNYEGEPDEPDSYED